MRKSRFLTLVLALALPLASNAQQVYYEDAKSVGIFDETMAEHSAYVVSFNKSLHQPNWLSFSISKKQAQGASKEAPAKAVFGVDPLVKTGMMTPKDYIDSGYKLGSLVPAAAMKADAETYLEAFYLSTMCPMEVKFYEQMWVPMQKKLLSWAESYGKLYVCCGPIYLDDMQKTAGPKKTIVPNGIFVTCVQERQNDMWYGIGFLLPNNCVRTDFRSCIFPIAQIGEVAGIEFFYQLPEDIRAEVLYQNDPSPWLYN